jgi:hypothetical protein
VAGWRRRYLSIIATVAIGAAAAPTTTTAASAQVRPLAAAATTACASGTGPSGLNARFASGIGPVRGADYQRAFPLPGGRTLWLFQDAFIRVPSGATRLVHNIGLVQSGRCFTLLRSGTSSNPRPWIGAGRTTPRRHWFWPLAGTVAADGTFKLFVAEMVERGPRYLSKTEPVATWIATISLPRLQVTSLRPAPDRSPQLYGWSVVDHGSFTYLYGHCYRQFGWSFLGHHRCAANVRVARVPRGRLDARPTYWNGARWSARPRSAVNVAPRRGPRGEARDVNPMQMAQVGRCWIAVTKVGDWFGDSIYLDRAPSPAGPWRTAAVIPARPLGPPDTYNTYFASFIGRSAGAQTIGLSNNRWDGELSSAYRPTFRSVPLTTWGRC